MFMSPADCFRRRAHECQETAALFSGQPEMELWLSIAAEYEQMAEDACRKQSPQLAQSPHAAAPENLKRQG